MPTPLPILCIGGAPSSGTTLLADLMDSVPGVVCPPEMHLFCVEGAYRYDERFRARAAARRAMPNRAIYAAASRFFNWKYRHTAGVGKANITSAIESASDLRGFVEWYARKHAAWRGMAGGSVRAFAEKTPLNVVWAAEFCRAFPATMPGGGAAAGPGLFIHLVRDGRAVAASLVRRGFSLYEAAMIWLHQVHAGRQAAERFAHAIEVRYEDLLDDPYGITAGLADRVGLSVTASEVKAGMRANEFRAALPRVESWQVPQWAGGIQHPSHYSTQLSAYNLRWLEGLELLRVTGPGRPGVEAVASFRETLGHYGYPVAASNPAATDPQPRRTAACYGEYLQKSRNLDRQNHLVILHSEDAIEAEIDHRTMHRVAAPMRRPRDRWLMWEAYVRGDHDWIRRLATLGDVVTS